MTNIKGNVSLVSNHGRNYSCKGKITYSKDVLQRKQNKLVVSHHGVSGAKLLFFIVLPLRTGYITTVCGTERRYNWNSESLPDVPMYKIIGFNMHTKTSRMNSNHRACPRCILVIVRQ